MNNSVEELINALTEKGSVLQEMLAILEEEQRCIVELDIASLEASGERKVKVIERMQGLNDRCRRFIEQAGVECGVEEPFTLTPLIARLDVPEGERLTDLQSRLLSIHSSMDQLLSVNRGLIEESIHSMDHSLAFFQRILRFADTYGNGGHMVEGAVEGSIVYREA